MLDLTCPTQPPKCWHYRHIPPILVHYAYFLHKKHSKVKKPYPRKMKKLNMVSPFLKE
jgi:hypothetical protein